MHEGLCEHRVGHLSPPGEFGDVFLWWEMMPEPNLEGKTKISQVKLIGTQASKEKGLYLIQELGEILGAAWGF